MSTAAEPAEDPASPLQLSSAAWPAAGTAVPAPLPPASGEPEPQRISLQCGVVHVLPGRVRLRVPQLRHDPRLAAALTGYVERLQGVRHVRAAPACASLIVGFDPTQVTVSELTKLLAGGLPVAPAVGQHAGSMVRQIARPGPSALVCGGLALGLSLLGAPALVTAGLTAVGAVPIVARAGRGLFGERHLTVDTLDATAVGLLAIRGDYVAASLSVALIAGGEYIRALTARRSRSALAGLLSTTGRFAWVIRGARKERLPAAQLATGDTIVVYPGDLVLVDGVVIRGRALVDQKVLTGESTPALKRPGDRVFASTLLTDGKLYVRTEQVGSATRAQRVVQILEAAPTHDTRLGNHARRVADRLVAPGLALAGGVYAVTGDAARAISVLICDFATGIRVSAPTAVLAAMTAAARRDLLIKGGRALEQLARVDTIVFDKTGTLTLGAPRVTHVRAFGRHSCAEEVLALAAAAEARLAHPAAQAIVHAAQERGVIVPEREDSRYSVGLGVEAVVRGERVLIGDHPFLARAGVRLPASALALADRLGRRGASTAFVARDGAAIGLIGYADAPRPEAAAVLRGLRDRGVRQLIMVTGDNEQAAHFVARRVGITRVAADVFPAEKAEIVRRLQAEGHVVAVIGDGINDSPALAYADVSFSLKAGSDVARETADIVLHGDLYGLPQAIDTAREAMQRIRESVAIVAAPNAAGLALSTAGAIGPVAATALNNGASVAACLNALRPLLRRGASMPA